MKIFLNGVEQKRASGFIDYSTGEIDMVLDGVIPYGAPIRFYYDRMTPLQRFTEEVWKEDDDADA